MPETEFVPMWLLLATALALGVPWGIASLSQGTRSASATFQALSLPVIACAFAATGYLVVGFALHFGGIGLLFEHPDLQGLVWEWTAVTGERGATWGMAGWSGFGLQGAQTPVAYLLFVSALPAATLATLLPLLSLYQTAPRVVTILTTLLVAWIAYPLVANWTQGGGWLMNLGINLGAGRGFIDFGRSSIFILGGGIALAAMVGLPAAAAGHETGESDGSPLAGGWSTLGVGFLMIGGIAWLLANPLVDWTETEAVTTILNMILASAGGTIIALLLSWVLRSAVTVGLAARGFVAGWVAGLASVSLVTPLEAWIIGAIGGLLMALLIMTQARSQRWHDAGGVLSGLAMPSAWGILAVAVFSDISGQWRAQIIGLAFIFLLGFTLTSIVAIPLSWLLQWRSWRAGDRERELDAEPAADITETPEGVAEDAVDS